MVVELFELRREQYGPGAPVYGTIEAGSPPRIRPIGRPIEVSLDYLEVILPSRRKAAAMKKVSVVVDVKPGKDYRLGFCLDDCCPDGRRSDVEDSWITKVQFFEIRD